MTKRPRWIRPGSAYVVNDAGDHVTWTVDADWEWIPWWAFVRRRRCTHPRVIGIYGDAVWATMSTFRGLLSRGRCVVCGRLLRDLPREGGPDA